MLLDVAQPMEKAMNIIQERISMFLRPYMSLSLEIQTAKPT